MRRLRHLVLMGLLLATTAAFAQTPRDRPALLRELVQGLGEKASLATPNTWLGNQVFSSWIAYKPASFSITPNTVQVGTNTVLLGRLTSGVVGLYYNDNGTIRDLLAEKLDGTAFSGYVGVQAGINGAKADTAVTGALTRQLTTLNSQLASLTATVATNTAAINQRVTTTTYNAFITAQGIVDAGQNTSIASNATLIATKPAATTVSTYTSMTAAITSQPTVAAVFYVQADESAENAGTANDSNGNPINPISLYLYFPPNRLIQIPYYPN